MKKIIKSIISIVLVFSMILSASVLAAAESSIEVEYLEDMRLIYAETYDEAKAVLSETKLDGYKILNSNLNENTGKTGVWLAYKTTTQVDDAITDVAIMQMGGGYSVGNYQDMVAKSREDYLAMGETYLEAIEYFADAYYDGNFLADAAYRQLNLYGGYEKYPDERLGDLFVDGALKNNDLATIFFEGNSTAKSNIRKLLALGVSYNRDGKHYLEKVSDSAAKMDADKSVFKNEDYKELAAIIATSMPIFKRMFEELADHEDELDYEDDEFTELEIKYAEYKSIAERMRSTSYLGGKTLYDFILAYDKDSADNTALYPLVDALNDGQKAMTELCHYYDVVRYSMSDSPMDLINEQIAELEEKYKNDYVDVFFGVDRTLYTGSFALTNDAYRADAYVESSALTDALFGEDVLASTLIEIASGALGTGLAVWAIVRSIKGSAGARDAALQAAYASGKFKADATAFAEDFISMKADKIDELRRIAMSKDANALTSLSDDAWGAMNYNEKITNLLGYKKVFNAEQLKEVGQISQEYGRATSTSLADSTDEIAAAATRNYWIATGIIYVLSIAALTYSAIKLYNKIYDHYHPAYDEIPIAMVDVTHTIDGDKYVKYDVVYEAQLRDGENHPGDLNAFSGEKWNAIYYTKDSDAGKPLVADFEVSNTNNRASEGYAAVHRFGEVYCFDLNKNNFSSSSSSIFLSIARSKADKSDVTGVPEVVGAIFGVGYWLLAGTVGVVLGIGGTVLFQNVIKKKKTEEAEPADE